MGNQKSKQVQKSQRQNKNVINANVNQNIINNQVMQNDQGRASSVSPRKKRAAMLEEAKNWIQKEKERIANQDRGMEKLLPNLSLLSGESYGEYKEEPTRNDHLREMVDRTSEIYKKERDYNKIKHQHDTIENERNENMASLMESRTVGCDKETWNDLSWFVNANDEKTGKLLLNLYLGNGKKASKEDVNAALTMITMMIQNLDISEIDLTNDEALVQNAGKLEKLAGMIGAFDRLMDKTPAFLKEMPEKEQQELEEQCERLRAVTAYYIARKDVIGDYYYYRHKNSAISVDFPEMIPDEEVYKSRLRLSEKMILSYALGQNLLKISGKKELPELSLQKKEAKDYYEKAVKEGLERIKKPIRKADKQYLKAAEGDSDLDRKISSFYNSSDSRAEEHFVEKKINESEAVQYQAFLEELVDDRVKTETEKVQGAGTAVAAVRRNVEAMRAFLSGTMPPAGKQKGVSDDEMDNACLVAAMLYKRLIDSLTECEKKFEVTSPDIVSMFTKMKEQNIRDNEIFKERALEYRELVSTGKLESAGKFTWADALQYTRAEMYDLSDPNLKVEMTGAASSQLYVIHKNKSSAKGSGTLYFRKEDKVPPKGANKLVQEALSSSSLSEEEKSRIEKVMIEYYGDHKKMEAIGNVISELKRKKSSLSDIGKKLTGKIAGMKKLYGKEMDNNATMEKLGQIYVDVIDIYWKRTISKLKPKIRDERNLSNRNVATKRLATMLGIGSMVCDSRTAIVKKDNEIIKGNLMESSGGVEPADCLESCSDGVIGKLYALQIFDLLCGQADRHSSNYHCIIRDGKIADIRALDNDMAFGDLSFDQVKGGHYYLKALSDAALLGMPRAVTKRIMAMSPEYLDQTLGDILDRGELDMLWDRFRGVQRAIRNIKGTNDVKVRWVQPKVEEPDEKNAQILNEQSEAEKIARKKEQLAREINAQIQGEFVFVNNEDNDDRLRSLKVLKNQIEALKGGENINTVTMLEWYMLQDFHVNNRIKVRSTIVREKLGKKAK